MDYSRLHRRLAANCREAKGPDRKTEPLPSMAEQERTKSGALVDPLMGVIEILRNLEPGDRERVLRTASTFFYGNV